MNDGRTIKILTKKLAALRREVSGLKKAEKLHRKTEEALRESEEKFKSLADRTNAGVYIIQNGLYRYANLRWAEMLEYTVEEMVDKLAPEDTIHPEDFRNFSGENIRRRLAGEIESINYEVRLVTKTGKILHVEAYGSRIIYKGKPAIIGTILDITDRKRAEAELKKYQDHLEQLVTERTAALKESEKKYRDLVDNALVGVYQSTLDGRFLYVNHNFGRMMGFDNPEDAISSGALTLYKDQEVRNKFLQNLQKIGRINNHEMHLTTKAGNTIDVLVSATLKGDVISGMLMDITDRKQMEEKLIESQRRLADIIDFLPDATLVIDKEGCVIAWNKAMETMTGIKAEDILGKKDYEYALPIYGERRPLLIDMALNPDPQKEKKYATLQRLGGILFGEVLSPCLPPGDIYLSAAASVLRDSRGEVIGAIECIRDNTERKRLEERLNRAEKMEGLGRLAGGVAHDLNNVLGILVGYSELLADQLPKDSPLKKFADNIVQSSVRGAAIIQDLLTLARRGVVISEVVDLNRIAEDYLTTPEFERLTAEHPGVNIWTDLAPQLLNIKGSPIHLSKTLMNLVHNAMEAISEYGEITIKTENRHLDVPIRGYDSIKEGDYVILTVSDTGRGISAEDLCKIFEPFYTRKVMGRSGTGLGLAVVWGTVKDHNGYIDVHSEEGVGTSFRLYFPVTREELPAAGENVPLSAYRGKGELILVVDDVKEQRELAKNMLEKLGYRAETVSGGEEAIEFVERRKPDLIVMDMIMEPGMDGLETYRNVLRTNPGQRAIIVSGFSETDRVRKAQELGAGAFVRKPYILEKIGVAIRNELDRSSSPSASNSDHQ
jgi:PAS domain S-box-containing protein